jgi:hypothetical protein
MKESTYLESGKGKPKIILVSKPFQPPWTWLRSVVLISHVLGMEETPVNVSRISFIDLLMRPMTET